METAGTPGSNQNYQINYVQVSDPWTGYAMQRLAVGNVASTGGTLGLGFNTWLGYGYDQLGNGQGIAIVLPNGNVVPNARLGAGSIISTSARRQASPGFTRRAISSRSSRKGRNRSIRAIRPTTAVCRRRLHC